MEGNCNKQKIKQPDNIKKEERSLYVEDTIDNEKKDQLYHLAKQIIIQSHETILSNSSTSLPIKFNLWFLEISKAATCYH